MAAFCRFWGISPSEYKTLTLEECRVMTEFAEDEIDARNREAKKRRRG